MECVYCAVRTGSLNMICIIMLLVQPSLTLTSKFPPKRSPPPPCQSSVIMPPSKPKIRPQSSSFFLAPYCSSPFHSIFPCSLPKVLTCYQPVFTIRTSGHCLGTFRTIVFLFHSCNNNNNFYVRAVHFV